MTKPYVFDDSSDVWKVIAPGVISWVGTEFTIQGHFDRMLPTFILSRDGKEIHYSGSVADAKSQARAIAGQMIEMGLEP